MLWALFAGEVRGGRWCRSCSLKTNHISSVQSWWDYGTALFADWLKSSFSCCFSHVGTKIGGCGPFWFLPKTESQLFDSNHNGIDHILRSWSRRMAKHTLDEDLEKFVFLEMNNLLTVEEFATLLYTGDNDGDDNGFIFKYYGIVQRLLYFPILKD